MNDDEATVGPAELVRGALPGVASPRVAAAAAAALVLALGLAWAATHLGLAPKVRGGAFTIALLAWAHGAVWLTTGQLQRLDSGLADLSGASWAVAGLTFWLPVWGAWGLLSVL